MVLVFGVQPLLGMVSWHPGETSGSRPVMVSIAVRALHGNGGGGRPFFFFFFVTACHCLYYCSFPFCHA